MLKIKRRAQINPTGAFIVIVSMLIGLIIGITICPQTDFSSCTSAVQDTHLFLTDNGVNDDIVEAFVKSSSSNYMANINKCLDL